MAGYTTVAMPPTTSDVEFRTRRDGDTAVVAAVGGIDIASAGQFEDALLAALERNPSTIIADLRRTGHFDSRGIGALVRVLRRCRRARVAFVVCAQPGGGVRRVLELSGIDGALDIVDTC